MGLQVAPIFKFERNLAMLSTVLRKQDIQINVTLLFQDNVYCEYILEAPQ